MATFIGALLAFIFSLFLFLLQEKLRENARIKKLKSSLTREINYNLSFLDKYKSEIDDLIGKIQVDDKQVYTIMQYHRFQRLFLQQAFVEGILYEKIPDDIDKLASIFEWFSDNTNSFGWQIINGYREGTVTQAAAREHFKYDLNKLKEAIELLKKIESALK